MFAVVKDVVVSTHLMLSAPLHVVECLPKEAVSGSGTAVHEVSPCNVWWCVDIIWQHVVIAEITVPGCVRVRILRSQSYLCPRREESEQL
jgi:hypothetical protein